MKTIVKTITAIMFFTFLMGSAYADKVERKIQKEFAVNKDALLKVSNKYGSIHCENWGQNKVSITVNISIEAGSTSKAKSVMDKIKIDISGSASRVEAITQLNNLNCNNCDIEIDYFIKMPATLNVDLLMKYGELFFDETSGEAKIGVKYGTMEVNSLSHDSKVYLGYSEASIGKISSGNVDIQYSEFSLDEADEIELESKYSDVKIGSIRSMELNTSYDDLGINEAYALNCDANFSDVEIGLIQKELIIDMNYGELDVDNVDNEFNKIVIYSNYADAEIEIDENAGYTLEADLSYCSLSFPKSRADIRIYEKSHSSETIKGTVGSKNAQSSVYVKAKHADIKISD